MGVACITVGIFYNCVRGWNETLYSQALYGVNKRNLKEGTAPTEGFVTISTLT